MLLPISNRIVPMPNRQGLPFRRGHIPGALGRLHFHIVLGDFGDLVGQRLELGNDRQGDVACNTDNFFVQLRNPCCGVGAASGGYRFRAHSHDLLSALGIVFRSRLELFDARTILGRSWIF